MSAELYRAQKALLLSCRRCGDFSRFFFIPLAAADHPAAITQVLAQAWSPLCPSPAAASVSYAEALCRSVLCSGADMLVIDLIPPRRVLFVAMPRQGMPARPQPPPVSQHPAAGSAACGKSAVNDEVKSNPLPAPTRWLSCF